MRFSVLIIIIFLVGCYSATIDEKGTLEIDWTKAEKIEIKYAKGFEIEKWENYYRIKILNPQDNFIYKTYVLAREKEEKPKLKEGEELIIYPIKTFTSVSTTHLPFIQLIDEKKSLIGFAGKKFILDADFILLGESVTELGADNNLNIEKIIELMPDLLMVYPFESLTFETVTEAGIPVFYNTDYLELHPLGKVEWIKLFGILFDKNEKALKEFKAIEERYLAIKNTTDTIKVNPTAFTGSYQASTWYVPGGNSFQAQFLKDAGVNYVWKENTQNNSLTLAKEIVYEKCIDVDFWIKVAAENKDYSLTHLKNEDPAFREFKSVINQQVIFCNSNEVDYFGKGIIEPDIILKDLVYFFHPEIFSNYQPKYFHSLQ